MHAVVLIDLASPLEVEAQALAADRGTTAYEARLTLAAGLPAIVLTTADPSAAADLGAKIAARGHRVVAFDASAVVAPAAMISMRRFIFEADGVILADRAGERLPYADIAALFRAVHRTQTETHSESKTTKLSVGRAIATGGLVLTKTVARDERTVAHDRDEVLYVFRRSRATPWILHERGTQYSGLGGDLAPSSMQNFLATIARLREHAPQARYDERLLMLRGVAATSVPLRAHALALV